MHTSQPPRLEAEDPYLLGRPRSAARATRWGYASRETRCGEAAQLPPLALLSPFLLNHLSLLCRQVPKPHVCQVPLKALLAAARASWYPVRAQSIVRVVVLVVVRRRLADDACARIVGLTEQQAAALGRCDVYVASFRPMKTLFAGRQDRMLMKLIVESASQRVLGCHIVGEGAGEMIQLAAIAVKMGATKADFDATVAVHPTVAEELVTLRKATRSIGPA